jgi:multicomponent Na+:H+ antiporter subunit E
MKKVGTFITTFVFSFVIYLILVNTAGTEAILIGLAVSLIASVVLIRFIDFPLRFLSPIRWIFFILYLPYFIKEVIKANVRIALIVLNPRLPIKPEMKRGKTKLATPHGKLLLSSSITLTPGTLTVDVNRDEFQIHCVSETKSADEIMRPFEKYIQRITE